MNHNQLKEYIKDLELYADQNIAVLETFLNKEYSKTNPPPLAPRVPFPIQLVAGVVLGISAALASGLRVFDRFFTVAFMSSQNEILSNFEAVFAVIAINGAIMLLPFVLRRNVEKIAGEEKSANNTIFIVSLGVALLISFIAGFGQSLVGVKASGNFVDGFDWILAFSLSLITALEYLFGDVIARNLDSYIDKKELARLSHDEALKNWRSSGKGKLGAWLTRYEKGKISIVEENENSPSPRSGNGAPRRSRNQKEQIKVFLANLYNETGAVPSFKDAMDSFVEALVEAGSVKNTDEARERFAHSMKGQMSTARNEWLVENNLTE